MSVTAQDPVLAWRRVANAIHSFRPSTQALLNGFASWLKQQGGNPDLKFMPFDTLAATETIVADAACKLYCLVLKKGTVATATFSKLTDSATTSSDDSADVVVLQNVANEETVLFWPKGLSLANGATMQGNTTASGGTASGATAGAKGFALLGAA